MRGEQGREERPLLGRAARRLSSFGNICNERSRYASIFSLKQLRERRARNSRRRLRAVAGKHALTCSRRFMSLRDRFIHKPPHRADGRILLAKKWYPLYKQDKSRSEFNTPRKQTSERHNEDSSLCNGSSRNGADVLMTGKHDQQSKGVMAMSIQK